MADTPLIKTDMHHVEAGEALTFGEVVYVKSDGKAWLHPGTAAVKQWFIAFTDAAAGAQVALFKPRAGGVASVFVVGGTDVAVGDELIMSSATAGSLSKTGVGTGADARAVALEAQADAAPTRIEVIVY